ncbi:MAG: competence/damage-inducible protein A [Pseudomonadota bacterium]
MSEDNRVVTACLIIIGNEILSGRTQDANLSFLGRRLNEEGVRLAEVRVLPDSLEILPPAISEVSGKFDYVFTTGGIGPTHDDITVDCVAAAFAVPVIEHPEARRILEDYYGNSLTDSRLRMARTPEGASLVPNPVSGAPGIRMNNVYIFAGVPKIMQAQFDAIAHELNGGAPLLSESIAASLPESVVASGLAEIQEHFTEVEIGSYPFQKGGRFGTTLVVRSADPDALKAASEAIMALVVSLGGERDSSVA